MRKPPVYRRRSDGVLEIRNRSPHRRELLLTGAVSLGGIALVVTLAAALARHQGAVSYLRTAGPASVCWNWSAGAASGCWTR